MGILSTGSYLPERVMTNADWEKIIDTTDQWIRERTGIIERRIASDSEANSDLSYNAGKRALENGDIPVSEIDMVIVATITPDMIFPSTASIVAEKLGIDDAMCFDIEATCSGFLFALTVAEQFVLTGKCGKVLVIGGEVLSRIMDWKDRSTCILFGDGAGAAVIGEVSDGRGLINTKIRSNAGGKNILLIPAGGSRIPASAESVSNNLHYMKMKGNEVFKFAVNCLYDVTMSVLKESGITMDDVGLFIPHQANGRIIDAVAEKIGLPADKVFKNVQKVGNMSAASVIVALDEAVGMNMVKDDDIIVMSAFGGSWTWGSCVLRWGR